ncbi:hypothetical protein ACFQX6_30880 [Streptosporangium lutulentum]
MLSCRAGPSRWVTQCTEPWTSTALARPVSSTARSCSRLPALTWYGCRPRGGEPSVTSSLRPSPSRSSRR